MAPPLVAPPVSRAEALKKVKENYDLDKPTNANNHVIEGKRDEETHITADQLPELPVVHFRGNVGCKFTLASCATAIKVLFEGNQGCSLTLQAGCKLTTGTVELWSCTSCTLDVNMPLGTLQMDISRGITVSFGHEDHMGSVVQAGVFDLTLRVLAPSDGANDFSELKTGVDELRAAHPGVDINDTTDQFITRIVGGAMLTERVLRLSNDFPTTAREKKEFDRKTAIKAAAMDGMVKDMLGSGVKEQLSEAERKRLQQMAAEAVKSSKEGREGDDELGELEQRGGDATARAEFKKKLGNEAFQAGNPQQAAVHYTEALLLVPDNYLLYSNRSACWLRLGQVDKALEDADKAISLGEGKSHAKSHYRRGMALMELSRYEEAMPAFATAIDLQPKDCRQAKASLQIAQVKAAKARAMA
eukprot:jgi/Mesvir1/16095/Mv08389-RA.1